VTGPNLRTYPGKPIPWTTLNTREATDKLSPGELQTISNFTFDSLGSLKKHGGNTEVSSQTITAFGFQPAENTASTATVYWDSTPTVHDSVHLKGSNIGLLFDLSTVTGTVQSATLTLKSAGTDTLGGNLYRATSAFTETTSTPPTYDSSGAIPFASTGIVDADNVITLTTSMITAMIATNYGFLLNVTSGTGAFQADWTTLGSVCGGTFDGLTIQTINRTTATQDSADTGSMRIATIYGSGITGSSYSFIGSNGSSPYSNIDYINRSSITTNSLNTGTLSTYRRYVSGLSGSTYGFFGGGSIEVSPYTSNVIDNIVLATQTQNAVNTGTLTVARSLATCLSGSTYGFFCGGDGVTGTTNVIDNIVLATQTQNAVNTGTLSRSTTYSAGVYGSTYGFVCGGYVPISGVTNIIEQITLATQTQNASDIGNLSEAKRFLTGISGSTYGYLCGGQLFSGTSNVIEQITLATQTQNAVDTGDLLHANYGGSGVS
jgi:hypothetical protein